LTLTQPEGNPMQLELDSNEAETLVRALESYLSDLSMEIADTDLKDYRDGLKAKRDTLRGIHRRIMDRR